MTMQGFSDKDLGVIRKRDALYGIRGWMVSAHDGSLRGVHGISWLPGPHRAACAVHAQGHGDDVIPFRECLCGFWAGYTDGPLRDFGYGDKPVVGVMRGWGKVVGGEHGFRAERAEIAGLHLAYEYVRYLRPKASDRDAAGWIDAGQDYGVGTESGARLAKDEAALAERYPGVPFYQSIPDLLRAHPVRKRRD